MIWRLISRPPNTPGAGAADPATAGESAAKARKGAARPETSAADRPNRDRLDKFT